MLIFSEVFKDISFMEILFLLIYMYTHSNYHQYFKNPDILVVSVAWQTLRDNF